MILRQTSKTLFKQNKHTFAPGTRDYLMEKKEVTNLEKWMKDSVKRDILEASGFIVNNKIVPPSYSINSSGFRCKEFNKKSTGIVTLGCSDTFGQYQYLEKTWPSILGSYLNQEVWNLSNPGGDIGSNYISLLKHSKSIKYDKIFILIPSPYRELYLKKIEGKKSGFTTRHPLGEDDKYYRQLVKHYIVNKDTFKEIFYFNVDTFQNNLNRMFYINSYLDAINGIARKNNAKIYFVPNITYYQKNTVKEPYFVKQLKARHAPDLACDLKHFGKTYQKIIANYFIKMLRN